jgi:hypothetical protein
MAPIPCVHAVILPRHTEGDALKHPPRVLPCCWIVRYYFFFAAFFAAFFAGAFLAAFLVAICLFSLSMGCIDFLQKKMQLKKI